MCAGHDLHCYVVAGALLSTSTVVQVHELLAFTSEPLTGCISHMLLLPLYLLVTNKSPYKQLMYHVLSHTDTSDMSVVDAGK